MSDPVFKSAHEALLFAFRFAGQQGPNSPMRVMLQGGAAGSGRGLVGIDGAGQAGMVLAALAHLTPEQRHVLVVRYGDLPQPCPCCGTLAPTVEWREALAALSLGQELADLPKDVRLAAVEKVVCRRKGMLVARMATAGGYDVAERTVRRRMSDFKQRIGRVENAALGWLEDYFQGRELLAAA